MKVNPWATQKQSLEATINKQLSMQKVGKRDIGTGRDDDGYMILIHHGLIQQFYGFITQSIAMPIRFRVLGFGF